MIQWEKTMNIAPISKFYNASFKGIGKETLENKSKEERLNNIVDKVRQAVYERAEMEVPENGKFGGISVSFDVPTTDNEAKVIICHDEIDPKNLRRVAIGVHRNGSDRLNSSYILKGTKKEILEYFKNPESQSKIVKVAGQLSDSVDKYYSEQ